MSTKKWISMLWYLFRTIISRSIMKEQTNSIQLMPIHTIISYTSKLLSMVLLSFSVAFCGGDNEITGDDPIPPPSCSIDGQVYNTEENSCQCPEEQFLNAEQDACVSSCLEGQIKPDEKDACEPEMVCTGRKVLDMSTNECIGLVCEDGQIPDTTVDPPVCIAKNACQTATDKVVSTDGNTCTTKSTCINTTRQIATPSGDCKVCLNDKVRSTDKTLCIDATTCTNVDGQVTTASGDCEACEGNTPVRSADETSCIATDTCINVDGQVATASGNCEVCGSGKVRSRALDECLDMCPRGQIAPLSSGTCEVTMTCSAGLVLNPVNNLCLSPTACTDMARHVVASGTCQPCEGNTPVRSADETSCIATDTCTNVDGQVATASGNCKACARRQRLEV